MFRLLLICGCLLAVAQAGVIGLGGGLLAGAPAAVAVQQAALPLSLPATAALAVPTIATSSSNIIRGIGNVGAVSAYSKSVDTPFSSERKADVRVNNPDILTAATGPALAVANTALAAPLATTAYAAPGLIGSGLATAIAGPAAITTGLGSHLGIGGLALNGLGAVKVL